MGRKEGVSACTEWHWGTLRGKNMEEPSWPEQLTQTKLLQMCVGTESTG